MRAAIHAENLGKFLLRLTIGILLLFHADAFFHGDRGIPIVVAAWGLPILLVYVGVLLEVAGSVSIILGLFTRIGALAVTVFMLAAVAMVDIMKVPGLPFSGNHLFLRGTNPFGIPDRYFLETQALFLFGAVAIALLGPGTCSLDRRLNLGRVFGRKREMVADRGVVTRK